MSPDNAAKTRNIKRYGQYVARAIRKEAQKLYTERSIT